MDALRLIVGNMEKEELRAFKLYAKKMNTRGERKDLELFDYVRKHPDDYDEDEIFEALYAGKSRNNLHRLRSRLTQEVNKSLILQELDQSEQLGLHHLLMLVELYLDRSQYKLANHYLGKAERLAEKLEHFLLLDLIFDKRIQLSHQLVNINPEEYIQKRKENRAKLNKISEIDDALAAAIYRLRLTQNFSGTENNVVTILEKTLWEFTGDNSEINSPRIQLRIVDLVCRLLLEKRDYSAMAEYLEVTYPRLQKDGVFSRHTHNNRLQLLTFWVNALFLNQKHRKALEVAAEMAAAMEGFDRLHYEKYAFFYFNALVNNYTVLNVDKAIEILKEMRENPVIRKTPYHLLFVQINLSVSYFNKGAFRTSIKELVRINILDAYKSAAPGLKLNIALLEMVNRYLLKDMEVVVTRIPQIQRQFREEFAAGNFQREKKMLKILRKLVDTAVVTEDKRLVSQIHEFLNTPKPETSNHEIADYDSFLKEQLES